jgi:hypothetical protein
MTVWQDPEFDAGLRAFYYARVLEIPTPRWTAFDALRFKVKMTPDVPMTLQERAFTSPIWYSPAGTEVAETVAKQYKPNTSAVATVARNPILID